MNILPSLAGEELSLGYDREPICTDLSLKIPPGSFTVIIGPNACGKSTLLRALSRLLAPRAGNVFLDGRNISQFDSKTLARRLGLLPQSSSAPDGITVADLVGRGRFPHQSFLRQWSPADREAVERAMAATGISELAQRRVGELSGGQRQRVWLALVLAQETPLLLLDEPTTFLDIAHQIEVLNLCRDLHRSGQYTLVAVLHDLNLAFRYADNLVVMRDGAIVAQGAPDRIVTPELIKQTYGIKCTIVPDPYTGSPLVVPDPCQTESVVTTI